MKSKGYVVCSACGEWVRGYTPRGNATVLNAFKHGGTIMHGPKCDGSYRQGSESKFDDEYERTKLPPTNQRTA